jgi:hypothetical protein
MNAITCFKRLATLDIDATVNSTLQLGRTQEEDVIFWIHQHLIETGQTQDIPLLKSFLRYQLEVGKVWAKVWLEDSPSGQALIEAHALNREAQERLNLFQAVWQVTQNVPLATQAAVHHYQFEADTFSTPQDQQRFEAQLQSDHQRVWRQYNPVAYQAFQRVQNQFKPLLKALWDETPIAMNTLTGIALGATEPTNLQRYQLSTKISKLNKQLEKIWGKNQLRYDSPFKAGFR